MHEKIKRKCSFIAAMILTAVLFTGCAVQTNITFQENGSGRYEETISFAESTWEQIFSEDESDILNYYRTLYPQAEVFVSNETIRGTASKVLRLRMNFKDISEYRQLTSQTELLYSVTMQPNYFTRCKIYMPSDENTDEVFGFMDELEQMLESNDEFSQKMYEEIQNMDIRMSMTFPYSVTKTNGSVQEDHKTVVWDMKEMDKSERLYALFHTSNSVSAPKYTGADNGKNYNTGVSLKITSENLLNQVKVNDETTQSDTLFLSDEGVYNIKAYDINGNSSRITFRIDKTKPTVSGVKSGKTYNAPRIIKFSDKGGSGIRSATLNGTSIKSGKKISKKGTYRLIITDNAGNKKTVSFNMN